MYLGSAFSELDIEIPKDSLVVCGEHGPPFDKKFEAFGWNVICIDAHDFDEYEKAFEAAKNCKGKPTVIIQKSVKGKGVSFMENQVSWHGAAPNDEQYEIAMKELKETLAGLEA